MANKTEKNVPTLVNLMTEYQRDNEHARILRASKTEENPEVANLRKAEAEAKAVWKAARKARMTAEGENEIKTEILAMQAKHDENGKAVPEFEMFLAMVRPSSEIYKGFRGRKAKTA